MSVSTRRSCEFVPTSLPASRICGSNLSELMHEMSERPAVNNRIAVKTDNAILSPHSLKCREIFLDCSGNCRNWAQFPNSFSRTGPEKVSCSLMPASFSAFFSGRPTSSPVSPVPCDAFEPVHHKPMMPSSKLPHKCACGRQRCRRQESCSAGILRAVPRTSRPRRRAGAPANAD